MAGEAAHGRECIAKTVISGKLARKIISENLYFAPFPSMQYADNQRITANKIFCLFARRLFREILGMHATGSGRINAGNELLLTTEKRRLRFFPGAISDVA